MKNPARGLCRDPHGHAHPWDATLRTPRNMSRRGQRPARRRGPQSLLSRPHRHLKPHVTPTSVTSALSAAAPNRATPFLTPCGFRQAAYSPPPVPTAGLRRSSETRGSHRHRWLGARQARGAETGRQTVTRRSSAESSSVLYLEEDAAHALPQRGGPSRRRWSVVTAKFSQVLATHRRLREAHHSPFTHPSLTL